MNRKPIEADVIQVADQITNLDPLVEVSEVQAMINNHNAQLLPKARPLELKKTVFFTGYLISPADTAKLLGLVKIPPNLAESEIKYLANSILIVPRPADPSTLAKVGGMGYKQTWQVTGFSFYQGAIWAVRVAPVPPTSSVHTINHTPSIVLATYKKASPEAANHIQSWQPVPADKQYILQTQVGEKVQLRIENESDESRYDSLFDCRTLKRQHSPVPGLARNGLLNDEHKRLNNSGAHGRAGNVNRNKVGGSGPGYGRAGVGQGNTRGGRTGGSGQTSGRTARHKGQRGGYKSLDDIAPSHGRAQRGEPSYDDYTPGGANHDVNFLATKGAASQSAGGLPYGT